MENIAIYHFEAYGQKKDIVGNFGWQEAIAKAHEHFIELPEDEGAWFANDHDNSFVWVEGCYFFDD